MKENNIYTKYSAMIMLVLILEVNDNRFWKALEVARNEAISI
jgi:hypothetical protein